MKTKILWLAVTSPEPVVHGTSVCMQQVVACKRSGGSRRLVASARCRGLWLCCIPKNTFESLERPRSDGVLQYKYRHTQTLFIISPATAFNSTFFIRCEDTQK